MGARRHAQRVGNLLLKKQKWVSMLYSIKLPVRGVVTIFIPLSRSVGSIAYTLFLWSRLSAAPVELSTRYTPESRHNDRDRQYDCDRGISSFNTHLIIPLQQWFNIHINKSSTLNTRTTDSNPYWLLLDVRF